ncbi:MAG: hypothetical protein ACFBSF_06030 [Leptolyngbyaceae cyanobacterium]
MLNAYTLAATVAATLGGVWMTGASAIAASFRYITPTTNTLYTEAPAVVAGIPYDGTFINTIFNPFLEAEQTFSGFYQIQTGQLGEALSLRAVQQSPTDRTELGEAGITRIEYFDVPQPVADIPGAFVVPPGLTDFDFQFVPATVAGAPVVLSQGWSAVQVPEPKSTWNMLFLGLGLAFGANTSYLSKRRCKNQRGF